MRLYAQVDLEVGFREPVKRRPQRLTVTHGSRSCPLTCTQRCERCGKFLLYSGDGGVPSGMAMPRGHTESAAASRCTLRPPAAAGPPPQVHPGRRRAARRGGPEGVPVDPDGQGKQAAAELGGAAWAREGECAAGVVPLLLGSYEVVREGEALHPLIRSHVRFFMLLRHSGRSPTPARPTAPTGGAWSPSPPLSGLGHHPGLRPAPAFQLMAELEKAQNGREAHRRRLAREHAQRPAPQPSVAVPAPAAPAQPSTEGATLPQPVQPMLPPAQSPAGRPQAPLSRPRFTWRGLLRSRRIGRTRLALSMRERVLAHFP